jgi:hypothetical protein
MGFQNKGEISIKVYEQGKEFCLHKCKYGDRV